MDVLRAAHSHMCNVLEVVSADLGRQPDLEYMALKTSVWLCLRKMLPQGCFRGKEGINWSISAFKFQPYCNALFKANQVRNVWFRRRLEVDLESVAGTKFGTKPLERLLGVVTALLHRAYKLPYSNAAQTPPSLKKELAGKQSTERALYLTLSALRYRTCCPFCAECKICRQPSEASQ